MTKQITPEEDRKQVREQEFQALKTEISKINGYRITPRIDIELIRREQAKGRKYLDSIFGTIEMESDGTPILPRDTLIYGRLFNALREGLELLRADGQSPNAFSLDILNTYSWSNCRKNYTYFAIFYGEGQNGK